MRKWKLKKQLEFASIFHFHLWKFRKLFDLTFTFYHCSIYKYDEAMKAISLLKLPLAIATVDVVLCTDSSNAISWYSDCLKMRADLTMAIKRYFHHDGRMKIICRCSLIEAWNNPIFLESSKNWKQISFIRCPLVSKNWSNGTKQPLWSYPFVAFKWRKWKKKNKIFVDIGIPRILRTSMQTVTKLSLAYIPIIMMGWAYQRR